jgi:hypothetical protein
MMLADFTWSELLTGLAVTLLVYVPIPALVLFFLTRALIRKSRRK